MNSSVYIERFCSSNLGRLTWGLWGSDTPAGRRHAVGEISCPDTRVRQLAVAPSASARGRPLPEPQRLSLANVESESHPHTHTL